MVSVVPATRRAAIGEDGSQQQVATLAVMSRRRVISFMVTLPSFPVERAAPCGIAAG
jgi:hypothetical protein